MTLVQNSKSVLDFVLFFARCIHDLRYFKAQQKESEVEHGGAAVEGKVTLYSSSSSTFGMLTLRRVLRRRSRVKDPRRSGSVILPGHSGRSARKRRLKHTWVLVNRGELSQLPTQVSVLSHNWITAGPLRS